MPADIQTLYAAPERRPSLHRSPSGRSRHIPIHDYPVHFSGTGSEYFRIWIVNLLLVIVTFGIYWPWARRRKLQYLYHCTWVDGHAFDFHGNPRSMLRGSMLAGVLLAVYGMGNRVAGGASDGLNQRTVGTQKALFVRVQNRDQSTFGNVQAFS